MRGSLLWMVTRLGQESGERSKDRLMRVNRGLPVWRVFLAEACYQLWNKLGKGLAQAVPGGFEILRQGSGFGDSGHEVCVADPAGHGVQMDMTGNSGSGSLAEVQSEVKAMRFVEPVEGALGALRKID